MVKSCAVCGLPFNASGRAITCGPACSRQHRRERNRGYMNTRYGYKTWADRIASESPEQRVKRLARGRLYRRTVYREKAVERQRLRNQDPRHRAEKLAYMKTYNQRPEVRERERQRKRSPEYLACQRDYTNRYRERPEVLARRPAADKACRKRANERAAAVQLAVIAAEMEARRRP